MNRILVKRKHQVMRDQQEETHLLVAMVFYCCISEYGSSQYDRNMNKTNIALFSFPNKEKKPAVYKSWCNEIHKFKRKGGKDGITITKSTKDCELHFKPDEIKTTLGQGIKTLKTGVEVPSVYSFKRQNKTKQTRRSPQKRILSSDTNTNTLRRSPRKNLAVQTEKTLEDAKENYIGIVAFEINQRKIMIPHAIEPSTTSCESCDKYLADIQILISKIEMLNSENAELKNINQNLKIINSDISMRIFSYENISKDEGNFKSFTGLEFANTISYMTYLILGIIVKT